MVGGRQLKAVAATGGPVMINSAQLDITGCTTLSSRVSNSNKTDLRSEKPRKIRWGVKAKKSWSMYIVFRSFVRFGTGVDYLLIVVFRQHGWNILVQHFSI